MSINVASILGADIESVGSHVLGKGQNIRLKCFKKAVNINFLIQEICATGLIMISDRYKPPKIEMEITDFIIEQTHHYNGHAALQARISILIFTISVSQLSLYIIIIIIYCSFIVSTHG